MPKPIFSTFLRVALWGTAGLHLLLWGYWICVGSSRFSAIFEKAGERFSIWPHLFTVAFLELLLLLAVLWARDRDMKTCQAPEDERGHVARVTRKWVWISLLLALVGGPGSHLIMFGRSVAIIMRYQIRQVTAATGAPSTPTAPTDPSR